MDQGGARPKSQPLQPRPPATVTIRPHTTQYVSQQSRTYQQPHTYQQSHTYTLSGQQPRPTLTRTLTHGATQSRVITRPPYSHPVQVTQFDTSKMASKGANTPKMQAPATLNQDLLKMKPVGTIDPRIKKMPIAKKEEKKGPESYPGGFPCGIAKKGGQLIIKGPSKDILKFKTHLAMRDGVTFIEDDLASDRLIAMDFDQTLANIFLWAELGGLQGADVQERNLRQWAADGRLFKAFGGQERLTDIRMALHARKSRGDLICVLSSGYAQVIRPALQYVGLDKLIPKELVYGSDTWPFGISKSQRLAQLKKLHNRRKATLIDDDIGYCRVCQKEGHDVIWVRNQRGAQKHELDLLTRGEWHRQEDLSFNPPQPTTPR
eukprot:GEMP01054056.1.p1 GENE.GEMP01054056.1~~GEMP01054056.1.p1  ORF type:complete len:377 (+),score=63.33 GEMP01054056.1:197-1327(+)